MRGGRRRIAQDGQEFPGTHSRICLLPQVRQWHHEEPIPGG